MLMLHLLISAKFLLTSLLNTADAQELHLRSRLFFATAMDAGCIYLLVKGLVVAVVGTGNVLLVFSWNPSFFLTVI